MAALLYELLRVSQLIVIIILIVHKTLSFPEKKISQ